MSSAKLKTMMTTTMKFYLSSKEEDDLLQEFVQWQKSIDGGNRAERQAQKHKRIVMSIVQHSDDTETNYKYHSCPSFLNSWMSKLKDEEKDPSTIKAYLNSVKHFTDFIVASEKGLFKIKISKRLGYCSDSG